MQFLDLAGVKKFKQYIDENFTPIEDHENAEEVTAAALNDLNDRLMDVEDNTGEENVIEAITFNGSPATVANKTATITATIPAEVTESTVSGWGFTKNTGTLTGVSFNGNAATVTNGVASITATIPTDSNLVHITGTEHISGSKVFGGDVYLEENNTLFAHGTRSGFSWIEDADGYNIQSKLDEKYVKPSGGIPATDLASAVQTSLGKADTALQSFTETDPTVPSWAKQSTKPSYTASEVGALPDTTVIPTVPTISTNVVSDKASDVKTSSPKSVYEEVHPAVATSQPAGGFVPNIFYRLGTLTGAVTFTLATPSDSTIVNHYYWTFTAGSTAPTITWPSGISWFGGSAPTITAGKHYDVSILDNIAVCMEV